MPTPDTPRRSRARRVLRWAWRLGLIMLVVVLSAVALLFLPGVQTWLAHTMGERLSARFGTTFRIERIEIRPFGENRLHGVFVADLNGDTLIAADELWLRYPSISLSQRRMSLRTLELDRGVFHLRTAEGTTRSNLTELLDHMTGTDTSASDTSAGWRIVCRRINVRDMHFSYHDANIEPIPFGVDFDHVDVGQADIAAHDLRIDGGVIEAVLDSVALRERSGLVVERLRAKARVSGTGIHLDDLHLRTPDSDIHGRLTLGTESYASYDDFNNLVQMRADIDSALVEFADIALFAPDLQGMRLPVRVAGQVRGTVSELKGRKLDLRHGERTRFIGNVELSGLPDVANTFIVADVADLYVLPSDIERIPTTPFLSGRTVVLPPEVHRLEAVGFTGNFTGFLSSFTTYGDITTGAGDLRTDVTYERDTITDVVMLRGHVATSGMDVGRVLDIPYPRLLACDMRLSAKGRTLASAEADLEGVVHRIGLNDRDIGPITLNGRLERDLFNGHLTCDDEHLELVFDGLADLRGRWPRVDFAADIRKCDLRALGLMNGTGFSDLVLRARAQGELAPDSLRGSVELTDVLYCADTSDILIGDVLLESGHRMLRVSSDVLDLRVDGTILPTRVHEAAIDVLHSVLPSLAGTTARPPDPQSFAFNATIGKAQPLLDHFAPGLQVAAGTAIQGRLDTHTRDLDLHVQAPLLGLGAFQGDSVEIDIEKNIDLLAFRFQGRDQVIGDSLRMGDLSITGKAYQDDIELKADWINAKGTSNGTMAANATVLGPERFTIDLLPSRLHMGRGDWVSERTAHIRIDSSTMHIDTLDLHNNGQVVRLGGAIGRDSTLAMGFELHDLALENFAALVNGPTLQGKLSGDGRLFDLYNKPYMLSYLCLDSLAIERIPVGDLRFAASWNERTKLVDLNGWMRRDDLEALNFAGTLAPGGEQPIDLNLDLDRFDLRFIEPYLPEAISGIQGKVTGMIGIMGTLSEPVINGYADLDNAGLRINYLNTFYRFSHRVDIHPDMFTLDNVDLIDPSGNKARLNGTIIHHHLSKWNFDVAGTMERFNVLNTSVKDNSLFYGDAYATGDINVSGYLDNLEVNLTARTDRGTDIHFPLGGSKEVGAISFVRFVGPNGLNDTIVEAVDLSGIRLDLNVEVTPDAQLELIFDPTVGDIMRGRGQGNLAMTVTPSGDLSLRGDVELVEGDYLFTLRNLVNKRFSVEPGGRISWFGDPFNALINIDALYKLRAPLYDVMPVALRTEAYKKRVPVEVVMHLTQNLMNPDIGFEVRLPSVDEGVRTQVQSALSTADDLNKQVFTLIMLNRFSPSDATAGGSDVGVGTGTAATGTELFSNQVSNWLSQISNEFDLGVNWRGGDSNTQSEVEVAVSTQVLDDRLLLSTNVGVQYGATGEQQNNLIGDFSAEYILTQDGKIRLKAYSQSNDRNLNQADQAPTTQGVGVVYRKDFD